MKTLLNQLPDFSPNGMMVQEVDLKPDDVIQRLPVGESCVWLPFVGSGQLTLMLGSRWSMSCRSGTLSVEMEGQPSLAHSDVCYAELLNQLESHWLSKQPEALRCPLFLAYEAGWNIESRRVDGVALAVPDLEVHCPKEVFIFCDGKALSYRDREQPTLLQDDRQAFVPNYAEGLRLRPLQSEEEYLRGIARVTEHVRCGDSFQVNLSQGFSGSEPRHLRSWAKQAMTSQAPSFGAYWEAGGFGVMSLSPERLLLKEPNGDLVTRPIAGTLARHDHVSDPRCLGSRDSEKGINEAERRALTAFKKHPKELAEHNMLIDLERNDLGKVCEPGSVKVEEYLTIETLPHVHHLVSQVRGRMDDSRQLGDVIFAVFPGGTITGCPKLETMHIIDEIEVGERGAYTGSMGFLSKSSLDLNILIRSAQIVEETMTLRFGGGLVWDSKPQSEYLETLAKAKGLFLSLEQGGAKIDLDS